MKQDSESQEHHRQRSEFTRKLVQRSLDQSSVTCRCSDVIPRAIVQFWDDLRRLPRDVEECLASWSRWEQRGVKYLLFDEQAAHAFIVSALGVRHERAFERCYHPAMQADYFRLCYLLVEGGFYVDADDLCVAGDINWLFEDGRLKLQPLCYDTASGEMVNPSLFLRADAYDPCWTFYFNNNPLIARRGHPIIELALSQATELLELARENVLPEIQTTTGPGNLSKAIFDHAAMSEHSVDTELLVLREWGAVAVSQWPMSHRGDARNWRLSNQKRFEHGDV